MKPFARGNFGLEGDDSLRLLVNRFFERFVFRHRRFAASLPVDLLERLSREHAEQQAGNKQEGGDAFVGFGVVVEQRCLVAFSSVDKRPACVVAVAICKTCSRASWRFICISPPTNRKVRAAMSRLVSRA